MSICRPGGPYRFPCRALSPALNSFPSRIAISPDGRFAAVLNQGYGTEQSGLMQSIGVLDLKSGSYREFPEPNSRADEKSTLQSYFVGFVFSRDGRHLYASLSSTSKSGIAVYGFVDGAVVPERVIDIPVQPLAPGKVRTYDLENQPANVAASYPAGIALVPTKTGEQLIVADNLADNVVLVDVSTGRIVRSIDLAAASHFVPSEYPYGVIVNRAGTRAWVSEWNDSAVAELDLAAGTVTRRLMLPHRAQAGSSDHPTSLLLSHDEQTLFVAVSNATGSESDGVAAVDLRSGSPSVNYHIGLGGEGGVGSAAIGIALSKDGKRLYATAASLNAVAVFDVNNKVANIHEVLPGGFIPTEWYPSALAISGKDLLIASAKGEGAGPNNMRARVQSGLHPNPHPYIATLIGGSLQRLPLAGIDSNLHAYTHVVEENNLLHSDPGALRFAGGANPIRHVIYILKENRTYDQIFGDLPAGDGDPSLVMFGADVTPNEHRLALQFGVLDNFYDSGDVSANGHLWSDGADTSDYMENVWPVLYRGSKRPEDFGNPLDQGLSDPGDPGIGFIWDNLAAHGMSYRIYGEMVDSTWCRDLHANSPREGTPSAQSGVCASDEIKTGAPVPPELSDPTGASVHGHGPSRCSRTSARPGRRSGAISIHCMPTSNSPIPISTAPTSSCANSGSLFQRADRDRNCRHFLSSGSPTTIRLARSRVCQARAHRLPIMIWRWAALSTPFRTVRIGTTRRSLCSRTMRRMARIMWTPTARPRW